MAVTSRVDAYQRRHPRLGFPIAVLYKYLDDSGGNLAALLTYYGLLSLFPLLLLARPCWESSWPATPERSSRSLTR